MKGKKKPGAIIVNGERYPATVLQAIEHDEDGTPRTFRLLHDDESVHLDGGEKFWVVFAPPAMSRRRN